METLKYVTKNRGTIFSSLAQVEISKVIVEYDGCGDSGLIESIIAYSHETEDTASKLDKKVGFTAVHIAHRRSEAGVWETEETVIEKEVTLRTAIDEFCWDILERECAGWELDDGACGEFTFDVANRAVKCVHNARYTDYETSEIEL
jgi:hypothetical protein